MKKLLLLIGLIMCLKADAQPDIKHSIYFKDKKCVYDGNPPEGLSLYQWYWNIEAHSSGNFYAIRPVFVGTGANAQYDVLLYKLNAQFDTLWSKQIGGSEDDWIFSIKELSSGNLVLTGTTSSKDGDVPYGHSYSAKEIWVIKVDTSGNILDGNTFGGSNGSDMRSTILSTDGYLYLCGETLANDYDFTHPSFGGLDNDVWAAKLDTNLNIVWIRVFSGNSAEGGFSIEEVTPNMFVVGIITAGTNSEMLGNLARGVTDVLVYCIDSNKNTIWARRFGSSGLNDIRKCLVDPIEKHIYVIGNSQYGDLDVQYQTADSSMNVWVVKLDTLGNIVNSKAYGNKQAGYYTEEMSIVDAIWHNGHVWVTAYSRGGGADMDPRTGPISNNNTWIGMIDTQANLVGKYTIGNTGDDSPIDFFLKGSELFLHGWVVSPPTNSMSCSGQPLATYIVSIGVAPLGINELNTNPNTIKLYPNPNTGQLYVQIKDSKNGATIKYKIINQEGKTCLKGQYIENLEEQRIDISSLAPGSYILHIQSNKQQYSKQFLKQ
jgi:hypothetical protein